MVDPASPKNEPDADASKGDVGVSQSDIDALLGAAEDQAASLGDPQADAEKTPTADPSVDTLGRTPDEAVESSLAGEPKAPLESHPFELPEVGTTDISGIDATRVSMLNDVKLHVKIELGRTRMLVEEVLKLGEGSVVELDKPAGDPVEVFVNDRLVARGEVLVLNDNFCVRISEVKASDPHRIH